MKIYHQAAVIFAVLLTVCGSFPMCTVKASQSQEMPEAITEKETDFPVPEEPPMFHACIAFRQGYSVASCTHPLLSIALPSLNKGIASQAQIDIPAPIRSQ